MRARVPGRQLAVGVALLGAAIYVAWVGFRPQTFGDYPRMFAPGMNALLQGHIGNFFSLLPFDGAGGSIILRLPGALVGKLLVGTPQAIFRFGAVECVLALGLVGLWLARGLPESRKRLGAPVLVGLLVLLPFIFDEVLYGHPEGALGVSLCVAAVLLAAAKRPGLAGLALGLAVMNKPWGVFAVAPTLLAARERPLKVALVCGAVAGLWFVLEAWFGPPHFIASLHGAPSGVAHPVDVWWPFAYPHRPPGVTPAYYVPQFLNHHGRELAVLAGIAFALPLARRGQRTTDDCLALLALAFLLRCALDPGNHFYYQLPFIVSLAAWEARTSGVPVLALAQTGLLWLLFHTISGFASLEVQFLCYVAITLPAGLLLAATVCGRRGWLSSPLSDRYRRSHELSGGAAAEA